MIWQVPHPDFRLILDGIPYAWPDFQKNYPSHSATSFLNDWSAPTAEIYAQTSGTTGAPKTITLQKSAMCASALKTGSFLNLQSANTALLCLSDAHIAGKMMLVRAWLIGLRITVVAPQAAPLAAVSGNFDFCAMVPHQAANSLSDLHRIKQLILGGGSISMQLWDALTKLPVRCFQTFGATETVSHFAMRRVEGAAENQPYKCLPGVTVSTGLNSCLMVTAPDILKAPLETNDVAKVLRPDEFLWLGRLDHVINSGGVKIHPEVLEQRCTVAGLDAIAFVGLPHPTLGEQLVAVVKEQPENFSEIFSNWHPYEQPKKVVEIPIWPTTESGKLQRNVLRAAVLKILEHSAS